MTKQPAAPDLLTALQAARAQIATLGTPDDAFNNAIIAMCDAAIAHATGEHP
jgi:hypothetical protein